MSLLTFIEKSTEDNQDNQFDDQYKEEDESDYAETARAELDININNIHHYIRRPDPTRDDTRNETRNETRDDTRDDEETNKDDFDIYQSNLQALDAYYLSGIIDAEYEFWLMFDVSDYERKTAIRWVRWGDDEDNNRDNNKDNNKDNNRDNNNKRDKRTSNTKNRLRGDQ